MPSEQLNHTEVQPLPIEHVNEWVRTADTHAPFDQTVTISGEQGSAQVVLRDATFKRLKDEQGNVTRHPVVTIESPEGERYEIPAGDFLASWQGYNPSVLQQKESAEDNSELLPPVTMGMGEKALERVMSGESEYRDRAEKLFTLDSEKIEDNEGGKDEFAHMFADDETYARSTGVEKAAVNENKEIEPTPESETKATEAVRDALYDESLRTILERHAMLKGKIPIPAEFVKLLQSDNGARIDVGTYLLEKINNREVLMGMPHQIAVNAEKSSNLPMYDRFGKFTSREYTAMMAMSMLDGRFDYSRQDDAVYDPKAMVNGGQHRYAAKQLLERH